MTAAPDSEPSVCSYCGVPIPEEKHYCSSGCDLADRIPRGEVALPATGQLGAALGLCFLLFNQLLFLSLAWLKESTDEFDLARKLLIAGTVAGALSLVANAATFAIIRERRVADWILAALLSTLLGFGSLRSEAIISLECQAYALVCNLLSLSWLARGILLRKPVKTQQKLEGNA